MSTRIDDIGQTYRPFTHAQRLIREAVARQEEDVPAQRMEEAAWLLSVWLQAAYRHGILIELYPVTWAEMADTALTMIWRATAGDQS